MARDSLTDADPRWDAFAAREPYFAVLTSPRFLRANLTPAREREFFDTGQALLDAMLRTIELHVTPQFAPTAILEYGCGVGRLAIPLARHAALRAGPVLAVDRSTAMLEAARHAADRQGMVNLEFQTAAEFARSTRTFDFVTCYLVLQRLAPADGLALLRSLLQRLRPGGIGAFQVPYRSESTPLVRAARWARVHVPGANALANIVRRRPAGEPFLPTHVYDLDDVLQIMRDASFEAAHVVFEHQEGLASALILAEAPMSRTGTSAGAGNVAEPVDVGELIARTSMDDLNQSAEQYFASLKDWDHHLAKPFAHLDEAPHLLLDVVTMLQGLGLAPGMTVLEFGAGTGWCSRFLTQLGCRAILLDVSPTALRIARELYVRQPVFGDRPPPEFLEFDGRRIDLPDASVDRVVCLHAFHHAPNPDEVIAELGRVLRPGGVAGFAEPGPRHSRTSLSQFEMRTFGVVENDVDVPAIWRAAQAAGFVDVKLSVFYGLPFLVSLSDYEDLLAGGAMSARWAAATRMFLRNVRTFFLRKAGSERLDSRTVTGLACEIHAALAGGPPVAGQPFDLAVEVTNAGAATWLAANADPGGVTLGIRVRDASSPPREILERRESLAIPPREIAPGERVRLRVTMAPLAAGRYDVELDCVAERITWFAQLGGGHATVAVKVAPG